MFVAAFAALMVSPPQAVTDSALLQARAAEAAAAPACIQALRTGPVGGDACEAYKLTVRALRAAGGEEAVKASNWTTVATLWRQRSYNEHIRTMSVAGPAFQRTSGY